MRLKRENTVKLIGRRIWAALRCLLGEPAERYLARLSVSVEGTRRGATAGRCRESEWREGLLSHCLFNL